MNHTTPAADRTADAHHTVLHTGTDDCGEYHEVYCTNCAYEAHWSSEALAKQDMRQHRLTGQRMAEPGTRQWSTDAQRRMTGLAPANLPRRFVEPSPSYRVMTRTGECTRVAALTPRHAAEKVLGIDAPITCLGGVIDTGGEGYRRSDCTDVVRVFEDYGSMPIVTDGT